MKNMIIQFLKNFFVLKQTSTKNSLERERFTMLKGKIKNYKIILCIMHTSNGFESKQNHVLIKFSDLSSGFTLIKRKNFSKRVQRIKQEPSSPSSNQELNDS